MLWTHSKRIDNGPANGNAFRVNIRDFLRTRLHTRSGRFGTHCENQNATKSAQSHVFEHINRSSANDKHSFVVFIFEFEIKYREKTRSNKNRQVRSFGLRSGIIWCEVGMENAYGPFVEMRCEPLETVKRLMLTMTMLHMHAIRRARAQ